MAEVTLFTIGGNNVLPYVQYRQLTLDKQANGRSVLRCILRDYSESLSIDVRDEVEFEVDNTTVFGGVVWEAECKPIVKRDATGGSQGLEYVLNCVDYAAFTDVVLINGIYGPDTLEGLINDIVANLALHGITVSGAQETGPSLPAQGWEFLTTRQALDRLATQTGWIWRIAPDGTLRMFDPTTVASPISFDNPVPGTASGVQAIGWRKTLNNYANVVWLRYGPHGAAQVSETFTGDGSTASFALGYEFANLPTTQTVNVVIGGTPAVQTLGFEDNPGQWYINNARTHLVLASGPLGSGDTVTIDYFAVSPTNLQEIDATDYASYGPFEIVINDPNNLLADEAQSFVEGELRRRGGPYRTVSIRTTRTGIEPLMSVPVTNSKLGLSGNHLCIETRLRPIAQQQDFNALSDVAMTFQWDLTLVEGTEVTSWLNFFERRR